MKRFICLQAGHQNAKNNCDPVLAKGTGAPGEAEFTVRIRDAVSRKLLEKKNPDGTEAFMVQLVDATYNCDKNADKNDYALFLAIHYDADVYGKGGGFTDYPEPSTDFATKESQRISKVFNETYFPNSGIEFVYRTNANTRYYYMWKFLSAKTPCVLIECGVGQNAHDKVILADTEIVANAIVRSICKAFDVPYETTPVPTPTPEPPTDWKKKFEDEVEAHAQSRKNAQEKYEALEKSIQQKIDEATKPLNAKIENAIKALS